MSNKVVKPEKLAEAIQQELTVYGADVDNRLREVTASNMRKLVKKTKATAPIGKRHGRFRDKITADYSGTRERIAQRTRYRGAPIRATWYVKAPDYRLTHLIVHGHATKNGGRTRANPFLKNALDEVLPEYEREVEEVLKNGQ